MNRFYKFDDQLIRNLVKESKSLTSVCEKLSISTGGYSTKSLREYLEENNIDYSHFTQTKVPMTREKYEKNPKLCKKCGKPLSWDKRMNDFCDHSCSASYNNIGTIRNVNEKQNVKTKLDLISDEEFKEVINNSYTWLEIKSKFGYSGSTNTDLQEKIKNRAKSLGLELKIRKRDSNKDWSKITKGELFNYCKNWQSARTQIRKLAQKSFENSGKEYKCPICGYTNHVEIAHIKAVSDFSNDTIITEINNPSNLIGLCPNHHWEFDNGMLDITPYIKK